jgi:hypothetical protein
MTINRELLNDYLNELGEPILLMDGFDEACIGISQRINEPMLAVYSYDKMVDLLVVRDGMDVDEAMEFVDFNCVGAWIGERTPIIVRSVNSNMRGEVTQSNREASAAQVCIFPINDENEPVSQWFWDAEIIITTNGVPHHILGSNPACFGSIQSAFDWAYEWLKSNEYDVSNLEFEMNDKSHKGITKPRASR